MSAAPKMCENPCETCAKEGLPLLLTRYALMPKETGAPVLTGHLQDPDLTKVPLGQGAHYGLRLLRSGYVYVYDEARKHFDEYFVTADGFMSKMPPRVWAFKQQHKPATEFSCARNGAAPLANVITIRNPKHATKVWIAFSNAEWTKALFDQHQDAGHRVKHMRCITITGGKVAPQPGTAPIEQLQQHVPEFKMGQSSAAKAFGKFSPHPYNGRQHAAESLIKAAQQVRPQGGGAIVALHDPTALVSEIAGLMELRKNTYANHPESAKLRFAASSIVSLEYTIKEQAKQGAKLKAQNDAAVDAAIFSAVAQGHSASSLGIKESAPRKLSKSELQKMADDAWRSYTHDRTGKPRFDQAGSQAWLKNYTDEFLKFDASHIAPLAKAHVAWLQHRCMVSHLSCNFDGHDVDSGVAYTATVVDMMRGVSDKQPSYDLYLAWIKSGEFVAENLVMRALGFNQTELIAKLKEADAASVSLRVFPSDAVVGAVGAFMEKMPPGAQAELAALLAGLSGPALKYWDDFHAGKVNGKAAAAMAAVIGKQIVRVPVEGNREQFIQAFMRQLYKVDPALQAKPNELQAAIAKRVSQLKMEGVEMTGSRKLSWYVLLDKGVVAEATTKNLTGQALADEVAKSVRTPQDIQKLDMARAMNITGKLGTAATVVSGALMLVNYSKLLEDVAEGMSHDQAEAKTKLLLGKFALGAFVSEQTGSLLEKLGEQRLRNMMGRVGAYMPRALQWIGRFVGFGVGVILGLWDISKGVDEYKKGDFGLATGYIFSGTSAAVLSAAIWSVSMGWVALGPVGWAILAVGFVIWLGATFFIESNKENPIQAWLARCHFGHGSASEKYTSLDTHIEQYRRAMPQQ
jgi:hypothetical protein